MMSKLTVKISWEDVVDVEIGGIDMNDYPDFCDGYIESAYNLTADRPCTEEELEQLEADSDNMYQAKYNTLF